MTTRRPLALLLAVLCAGLGACQFIPGFESPPTPAATDTEVAAPPTFTPTLATAVETPSPLPEESPAETPVAPTPEAARTPEVRNTPAARETQVKTSRPRPAPTPKPTRIPTSTPVPIETETTSSPDFVADTPFVFSTDATPEETPEVPAGPEVKVASLSFKPGSKASLLTVEATSTGSQTVVKIELSVAGKYKILPLPQRRQVWIDFELVELSEPKTIAGKGSSLVKEISARSFEGGLVRVVVQLKDDGSPFPVIGPKKRSGESASVEVRIGPDP